MEQVMGNTERRICKRYQMHYPIIVSSSRGIDREEGWHYGEILDAGRNGIRLRVPDFGALRVGTELRLVCQPARDNAPASGCMPVPIQGTVVWENASAQEFALRYLQ
jgi:hypothetical protein